MTVDVSVRSGALSAEDWIISFPDGPPTYSKDGTVAKCSNRQKFRAADQEWERTHYQRQSTICGMVDDQQEVLTAPLLDRSHNTGGVIGRLNPWIHHIPRVSTFDISYFLKGAPHAARIRIVNEVLSFRLR